MLYPVYHVNYFKRVIWHELYITFSSLLYNAVSLTVYTWHIVQSSLRQITCFCSHISQNSRGARRRGVTLGKVLWADCFFVFTSSHLSVSVLWKHEITARRIITRLLTWQPGKRCTCDGDGELWGRAVWVPGSALKWPRNGLRAEILILEFADVFPVQTGS